MLSRSFASSLLLLLFGTASASLLACGDSPEATDDVVSQPSPTDCPGAVAELGTGLVVDVYDWRPITVDTEGILVNIEAVENGNPFLISGTTSGGFVPLPSSPTRSKVGVSGQSVFVVASSLDGGADPELEETSRSGGAATALTALDVGIHDLAATPSSLYLATDLGIEAIPRNGGAATLVYESAGSVSGTREDAPVTILALDGSTLVWSEGGLASPAPFTIRRASVDGPFTPQTLATLRAGEGVTNMVAANGAVLYLTTERNESGGISQSLYLLAASNGTPTVVDTFVPSSDATPRSGALPLAVGSGAAYYSFGGPLKRLALDGSNTTTTITAPGSNVDAVGASLEGDVMYTSGRCLYAEKG
jgi:hypothetical protein